MAHAANPDLDCECMAACAAEIMGVRSLGKEAPEEAPPEEIPPPAQPEGEWICKTENWI